MAEGPPKRTSASTDYKLLVLGANKSGKTALVTALLTGKAAAETTPTDAESNHAHTLTLDKNRFKCNLEIKDTGSFTSYENLHQQWFQWADGFVLVFSLVRVASLDFLINLLKKIKMARPHAPGIIVGTRADEPEDQIAVATEAAVSLAYQNDLLYTEVSAISMDNVEKAFKECVREIRSRRADRDAYYQCRYEHNRARAQQGKKPVKDEYSFFTSDPIASIDGDSKRRQNLLSKVNGKHKILDLHKRQEVVTIHGPPADEGEQSYKDYVAAQSVSTYPKNMKEGGRMGDPICDQYSMVHYQNRTLFAMADGCSWGTDARDAARKVAMTFLETMRKRQRLFTDVHTAICQMLRAFKIGHDAIVDGVSQEDVFNQGTTTLIGGGVFEIDTKKVSNQWMFVAVSLGDCKALHWSSRTGQITDMTEGNRHNVTDARDPGGRLGPYLGEGDPDLRNLEIYVHPVQKSDIIIILTDGVYDNFDPQHLGQDPKSLGLDLSDWQILDDYTPKDKENKEKMAVMSAAQDKKNEFARNFVNNLLGGARSISADAGTSPSKFVRTLITHVKTQTQSSRDFMEANPDKKLPKDYVKYPGKLDHSTVMAFKVGLRGTKEAVKNKKARDLGTLRHVPLRKLSPAEQNLIYRTRKPAPPPDAEDEDSFIGHVAVGSKTANEVGTAPISGKHMEGWKKYQTDIGEIYFFNDLTQESTWEDPWLSVMDCDWKVYYDDQGDPYYVNSQTNESVWEEPEEFKAFRLKKEAQQQS